MSNNHSLETLFGELITIQSEEDRRAYLDEACCDDVSLRQQLERLLAAHNGAGSFLGNAMESTAEFAAQQLIGSNVGPYKLLEKIGEGGMGHVFVAQQQRPLRRKVALKLIKPGMDSRAVLARFDAERQALALMDHPVLVLAVSAAKPLA